MPAKINLKIYKGATFNHFFAWKNPDGTPIILTGYYARMQIRKRIGEPDPPLVSLYSIGYSGYSGISVSGRSGWPGVLGLPVYGYITLTPSTGQILLTIDASVTAGLDWREGVYDLELCVISNNIEVVTRLAEGNVTTFEEVTKA